MKTFQITCWLPWWLSSKESLAVQETWVQSLGLEDPMQDEMAVFLSGKYYGLSLVGYNLRGCKVRHD